MGVIGDRRVYTKEKSQGLKDALTEAPIFAKDKACVYAIGSYGRVEAGSNSDIDLYIVGKSGKDQKTLLSPLDEICVKADVISAARQQSFPEFDAGGKYFVNYSIDDLIKTLGKPEDDAANTFTARLLLLLESKPIIGDDVRSYAIEEVIKSYWRDYEDHKNDFVPAFLANDILRLWRTFCVNYEARTQNQPEDKKARRTLKNFKLKHSRLLTCYSTLLCLLAIFGEKETVSPTDIATLCDITPTERIEWLLDRDDTSDAHAGLAKLLEQYERFLELTDRPEKDLVERIMNKTIGNDFFNSSYEFGETMFQVVTSIGKASKLHRLIVV